MCSNDIFISDEWFKYDDDDVSMVTDEDIKKLSGGGIIITSLLHHRSHDIHRWLACSIYIVICPKKNGNIVFIITVN